MTSLVRKLLTASAAAILCIGLAACGDGSSGAGATSPTTPSSPQDPPRAGPGGGGSSVQGVVTPSSVSVVTATNAD